MRNLLSGLVSGACMVVLWAVLTKPKAQPHAWHYCEAEGKICRMPRAHANG